MSRWVKNCSDYLLLDLELFVLEKGLNFGVTPCRDPGVDIVTTMASACRSLGSRDAHGLRAKVTHLLDRHDKVKDQNVTKNEWEAIEKLKKDDTIMVFYLLTRVE